MPLHVHVSKLLSLVKHMNTPPSVPRSHMDTPNEKKNDPSPSTFLPGINSFNADRSKYMHYSQMAVGQMEKLMDKKMDLKELRSSLVLSSLLSSATSPLDPPPREKKDRVSTIGNNQEGKRIVADTDAGNLQERGHKEHLQRVHQQDHQRDRKQIDHRSDQHVDFVAEPRVGSHRDHSILNHMLDVSIDKSYSEETMREVLRLRIEQERTKQTQYKYKLSQVALQLLKEAESHGLGGDLIEKLFLVDSGADFRNFMQWLGNQGEDFKRRIGGDFSRDSHNLMDHHGDSSNVHVSNNVNESNNVHDSSNDHVSNKVHESSDVQNSNIAHDSAKKSTSHAIQTPSPKELPETLMAVQNGLQSVSLSGSHPHSRGLQPPTARTRVNSMLESVTGALSVPFRLPNLVYLPQANPVYYVHGSDQRVQSGQTGSQIGSYGNQLSQSSQSGQTGRSEQAISGQSGQSEQAFQSSQKGNDDSENLGLPNLNYPGMIYQSLPQQFINPPNLFTQSIPHQMGIQTGTPYYYVNSLPPGMPPMLTSQYFVPPPPFPSGMIPWGGAVPTSEKKQDDEQHHKRQKGKNSINFMITTPKNPPARKYNKL